MFQRIESVNLPTWAKVYVPPARYKVVYGGRGSAKSWTFARMVLLRMAERKLRVLAAREYQNSIRESVHHLMQEQTEAMHLPGFRVLDTEIRHSNGGDVIFAGLKHNVASIKSIEGVDLCLVEEAETLSEESWRTLIPTIRKAGSEIWIVFNPRLETDPTYRRFVIEPPPGAVIRKVSWQDNPWFSDAMRGEMKHLYSVNPDEAAHVWGGEFAKRSNAAVITRYTVQEFTPIEGWNGPYYGADWGFSRDPTTLVRFWIAPDGGLYVEHEAWGIGVELDDLPNLFDLVPDSRQHTIRADEARPETISHMQRKGFRIIAAAKGKGSVEEGVTWLQSRQIVIHPRCRHTADEARTWSYKKDRLTGDPLPVLEPGNDHCFDAIRYGAQPMIRVRTWRPI